MKLKRILAMVLCAAMVLSTMSFNVFAEDDTNYVAQIGDQKFETVLEALKAAMESTTATELKLLQDSTELLPTDFEFIVNSDVVITADTPVAASFYNNGTTYDLIFGSENNNTITIDENVTLKVEDRNIWLGYYGDRNATVKVYGTLSAGYQLWSGSDVEVYGTLESLGEALVLRRGKTLMVDGGKVDANYFNILAGNIDAKNDAVIECGPVWIANVDGYAGEGNAEIVLDNATLTSSSNLKSATTHADGVSITIMNGSTASFAGGEHGASELNESTNLVVSGNSTQLDINAMTNNGKIEVADGAKVSATGTVTNNGTIEVEKEAMFEGEIFGNQPVTPAEPVWNGETIASVEDFITFAKVSQGGESFSGKTIKLTADIDFEGANYLEIAEDGTVVTDYRIPKFGGTFDGDGHSIKNFNFVVNDCGNHSVMMFSQDGMWAYIKNLNIENVNVNIADISGETRVTALANRVNAGGMTDAAIKNVHVKNFKIVSNNTTSGDLRIGGLAYFVQGSQLIAKDCSIDGFEVDVNEALLVGGAVAVVKSKCDFENVDVKNAVFNIDNFGSSGVIGGFVGQTQDQGTGTTFTDCDVTNIQMNLGDIKNDIGGFVGSIGAVSQFYNCTSEGSITITGGAANVAVGGFVGNLGWNGMYAPDVQHEFNNCVADVDITAVNANVGGFIGNSTVSGYPKRYMPTYFNDCEAKGDVVTTNGAAGGFVGTGDRGIFNDCVASGDATGKIAGGFWGEIYPKAEAESTGGWSYQDKVVTHTDVNSKSVVLEGLTVTGTATGTEYEAGLIGFMKDIYVNADDTLGYATPIVMTNNSTNDYNRYPYPAPEGTVAKIGDDHYFETLAAAITAAQPNDTIILIDNVTEDVTINKNITLDGADKDYTGLITIKANCLVGIENLNFVNGTGYAIRTEGGCSVNVKNCTANNYAYGFIYAPKSTNAIVVKNVTIENCNYGLRITSLNNATLENVKMTNVKYGVWTQSNGSKTFTFKNSEISAETATYVNGTDGVPTFIFQGENSMTSMYNGEYAKYVLAENSTLKADEGYNVTTDADGYFVKYVDGTYKAVKAIAQIGDVKYASLAEALAEGGDVILLADVENASKIAVNNNVSLDLNGKTISGVCDASQDYVFMVNNGATMTIKDSSAEKTGKITYAGNNSTGWIVDVEGKLVLESGTLELTGTWNIGYAVDVRPNAWGTPYTEETAFVMNGGKIVSSDGGVRVASSSADSYKNIVASFTMNDGEIEAAWDGVFVQQSNAAWDVLNVTINNGTIKSALNPVRFYGPAATSYANGEDCVDIQLNGGTLTYTGTEAREWVIDGILRIDGGVTADDFLKDSSVIASASFAAANNTSAGYEWKTIGSVSKLFKSATSATVKAFSDTSTVKAGDEVVVKVIAEGFDFTNGDWELRYDPTMFELDANATTYYEDSQKGVKAQSVNSADANTLAGEVIAVGGTLQQGNEIPSGTVLATYTFTVLPQSKDTVTGKFDIVNAHINTYDYAISQTNVKATPVDFEITITREGREITGSLEVASLTYNGDIQKGNAFVVSDSVVGKDDAVITYSTTENGIYTTELPTFKEAGSYSIWVKVNVDGYAEYKAEHAYMVIDAKDITLSLEVAAGAAYNKVNVKPVITGVYDAEFEGTLTISGVDYTYTKDDFIYIGSQMAIAKEAKPMSVVAGSNEVTITYTQAATDNYADASTTTTVDADKAFATQTIVDDLNAAADAAVTYTYNGTEHKAQDKINAPEGWSVVVTRISDGAANPGVTNVADKEFVEIRFTHANYNDVVVSRVLKVEALDLTIIVPDFEKGAGEPDDFTTKPVAYASDNFVASAEFGTIDDLVATGNLNVAIVRKTFGEEDGNYDLTATYTPNDNYEIVVDDGKLTIGMPSDTKIEVVNNMLNGNGNSSADYVAGYKLVLVYTNTATARYTYDNKQMFDLSNAGYEYFDNEKSVAEQTDDNYKYVYGIIVKAEGNADDAYYADKVDFIGTNKYKPEKIVYDADVNYDDKFTNNDTSSANSVLNVEYELDAFTMYYFLKADYDRTAEGDFKNDKMVKLFDVQEVQKFINTKTTIQ